MKDAETTPLTVSAAPSTWVGQGQTVSKGFENNKVPSVVRMYLSKCQEEGTWDFQDAEEEIAQELGLMRHQLQFKTRHQLNDLRERRLQRTFDEVNLAALAAQRKAEDNFARLKQQLASQMQKTSNIRRIKYMPHGLTKSKPKVTSSDK